MATTKCNQKHPYKNSAGEDRKCQLPKGHDGWHRVTEDNGQAVYEWRRKGK